MMKIVVSRIGPDIAAGSIESKQKTIYRVGDKYARIEEAPDPDQKRHLLIITKEPDSWMINLVDRTATHLLDPGPTFNSRLPIFWMPKPAGEDAERELIGLEFGLEEAYFLQHNPQKLGTRKVDDQECNVMAIKQGPVEVTLFLDSKTGKPVQIESARDGKPDFGYRYSSYQTDLPFDPSLFKLPEDIKITEQKSSSPTPSK